MVPSLVRYSRVNCPRCGMPADPGLIQGPTIVVVFSGMGAPRVVGSAVGDVEPDRLVVDAALGGGGPERQGHELAESAATDPRDDLRVVVGEGLDGDVA